MAFSLAHDLHIEGRVVRLRCAGTGKPLLLLHDIGGSGASFAGLTSAIVAAGREAVAPDLPGFAQSESIPGGLAEMVENVELMLDQTVEGDVDLVGTGFGGYLALTLAARRPERYQHLVLRDPITPPGAGGRSSGRMSAGMALNGAFTTVRRGRLLQNVGGFGRAKALLEELAHPDQPWWDSLRAITAKCLLLDTGDARADHRDRFRQLADAVYGLDIRPVGSGKSAESDIEQELLVFVS